MARRNGDVGQLRFEPQDSGEFVFGIGVGVQKGDRFAQ